MMDWSYALLSEPDQQVFRRLSVFAGEFSVDAAIAILEDDGHGHADIIESIGSLVDKSLLSPHPGTGPAHFMLTGIARTYAAYKLLATGERALIEERRSLYQAQAPRQCRGSMAVSSHNGRAIQLQA